MGGTMPYSRAVGRNHLATGDYDPDDTLGIIKGDLRRFERDTLAEQYVQECVLVSGATAAQVHRVLRYVLDAPEPDCADCQQAAESAAKYGDRPQIVGGRCHFHAYVMARPPRPISDGSGDSA